MKTIRRRVSDGLVTTIMYLVPAGIITIPTLNEYTKSWFITTVIFSIFSLAVLTSFTLYEVVGYLKDKENEKRD